MASSGNNLTSGTSSAVAELMPDPSNAPQNAAGSADDLIASIADQQIDALISDAGEAAPDKPANTNVAAELAVQATQELAQMAQKLSDEARADLVADLNGAATEAMLKPIPAADTTQEDEPHDPIALHATTNERSVAAAATAETTATESATNSIAADSTTNAPAPASTFSSAEIASAPVEPLPAIAPGPLPVPADTEVNQAEIDALINKAMPPAVEHDATANASHAHEEPHESSAEAVARELAEDLRHTAANLPPIVVVPLSARLRDAIETGVMTVLGLINWPVRNLSDNAREVMGIIAIVTLVNAMSLLLYLMIFR